MCGFADECWNANNIISKEDIAVYVSFTDKIEPLVGGGPMYGVPSLSHNHYLRYKYAARTAKF